MPDSPDTRDPISEQAFIAEPVAQLIALFHAQLATVRFPGADAAVLEQAAERVRAAAEELAQAEALVAGARAALTHAEEELLHKAQRARAYARIYAEESPALAAALDGIVLPSVAAGRTSSPGLPATTAPAPRRRGRPKTASATDQLFSARPSPDEPAMPADSPNH
jgi:hypothetical protein